MKLANLARIVGAVGIAAVCVGVARAYDEPRTEPKLERAAIDKNVNDFTLPDVMRDPKEGDKPDAAMVSLSSFKDKKNVVMFFMSEKCGTTWRYEKRFGNL